jgi:hypothetical protein
LTQMGLPESRSSCLNERVIISNSMNSLAKLCPWSEQAIALTARNIVSGLFPVNRIPGQNIADNMTSKKTPGNYTGATDRRKSVLKKTDPEMKLKGAPTVLLRNNKTAINNFHRRLIDISKAFVTIRQKKGEDAMPEQLTAETAGRIAAEDMDGMIDENYILNNLRTLNQLVDEKLEELGELLRHRCMLKNNQNSGQGLAKDLQGSALAFFIPASYDMSPQMMAYGDAADNETNKLADHVAFMHLIDPRLHQSPDEDDGENDSSSLARRYFLPHPDPYQNENNGSDESDGADN